MKQRYIQLFIGHIIFTFGISLLIIANIGASSWDTVYLGLKQHIGGTYGVWSFIVQVMIVLVISLLVKARPDVKSFISIVLSSVLIDFWLRFIFKGVQMDALPLKIIVFACGVFLLAFGIAVYIRTNLFSAPVDGLMIATANRFKLSLKTAKILNEVVIILIGFSLGGPVGVGTFFTSFGLGFGIQLSMKWIDTLKEKGWVYV